MKRDVLSQLKKWYYITTLHLFDVHATCSLFSLSWAPIKLFISHFSFFLALPFTRHVENDILTKLYCNLWKMTGVNAWRQCCKRRENIPGVKWITIFETACTAYVPSMCLCAYVCTPCTHTHVRSIHRQWPRGRRTASGSRRGGQRILNLWA